MIQFIRILLFFFLLVVTSCAKKLIANDLQRVERRKTSELTDALDSILFNKPKTFYSKISTKYKDTTQNISFKTSIRLVKDSAVNALITYATLPIYNSIVTKDSLTILNKREKCYTKTKLSYIKENFGISFDYKNIEELILGLPLAYDIKHKYFQIHDPYNYIVSSHRKREIRRADKKEKLQDDIIIKYYLSNDLKFLKRMDVESVADTASIQVYFNQREVINGFNSPKEVSIKIYTAKNNIDVQLEYEKIQINEPQQFHLVIPEEYEECK